MTMALLELLKPIRTTTPLEELGRMLDSYGSGGVNDLTLESDGEDDQDDENEAVDKDIEVDEDETGKDEADNNEDAKNALLHQDLD